MVQRNVAALADPPPAHAAAADRRDAISVWSEQELARFLRHAQLFRRLVHEAGLPAISMHDLRHTHATLLLRWGHNPKVVRLGHHSVAFTLDTYAHVVPGMLQEVAAKFGNLLPDVDDEDDDGLRGVPAVSPA